MSFLHLVQLVGQFIFLNLVSHDFFQKKSCKKERAFHEKRKVNKANKESCLKIH